MSPARDARRLIAAASLIAWVTITNCRASECDKNHYILDDPPCSQAATEIAIGPPGALAVDDRGNVYFSSPNIVFRIDGNGGLRRVAGNGEPGFTGDGGPAEKALLNFPRTYPERAREGGAMDFDVLLGPLAVDRTGNLYIGDAYNNRVRKVSADGVISTVAGNGKFFGFGDHGDGGPATGATITWPSGIAVGDDETVFVVSSYASFRRISAGGVISTVGGCNCGDNFLASGLCAPTGIALGPAGDVLATDAYCRVRSMRSDGVTVTIAGADARPDTQRGFAFTCGHSGDGGAAIGAAMGRAYSVATDKRGNVFVADTSNHCIRRIDAAGVISAFAGVCERLRRDGIYAPGGFSGDLGPANEARLRTPHGVAVDESGNVYIADTGNFRIRKVTPDGIIDTIAGNGADLPGAPKCGYLNGGWVCG